VCLLELLSGRPPTEDLLDLFGTYATSDTIHNALDSRVDDWVLEEVMVVAKMAIGCQDIMTSTRLTVLQVLAHTPTYIRPDTFTHSYAVLLQVLPRLEALHDPDSPAQEPN
jgi:hypothetical protein